MEKTTQRESIFIIDVLIFKFFLHILQQKKFFTLSNIQLFIFYF